MPQVFKSDRTGYIFGQTKMIRLNRFTSTFPKVRRKQMRRRFGLQKPESVCWQTTTPTVCVGYVII